LSLVVGFASATLWHVLHGLCMMHWISNKSTL